MTRVRGTGDGEQLQEGSEKDAKEEDMEDEKGSLEETGGKTEEGEKKDEEGSVVFSVDEKASQSSSVKAHVSGMFGLVKVKLREPSVYDNSSEGEALWKTVLLKGKFGRQIQIAPIPLILATDSFNVII